MYSSSSDNLSTLVHDDTCQILLKSVLLFQRFFRVFFIMCGHGGHLGIVQPRWCNG